MNCWNVEISMDVPIFRINTVLLLPEAFYNTCMPWSDCPCSLKDKFYLYMIHISFLLHFLSFPLLNLLNFPVLKSTLFCLLFRFDLFCLKSFCPCFLCWGLFFWCWDLSGEVVEDSWLTVFVFGRAVCISFWPGLELLFCCFPCLCFCFLGESFFFCDSSVASVSKIICVVSGLWKYYAQFVQI